MALLRVNGPDCAWCRNSAENPPSKLWPVSYLGGMPLTRLCSPLLQARNTWAVAEPVRNQRVNRAYGYLVVYSWTRNPIAEYCIITADAT